MKQTLQLRASQQLTLTPQLQQSIRLLQMSTVELNQELERVLDENPMLERAEAGEADELLPMLAAALTAQGASAADKADPGSEGLPAAADAATEIEADGGDATLLWDGGGSGGGDDDEDGFERQTAVTTSLRDHLIWQVQMSHLADADRQLVLWLIEAIDEDGYLTQSLDELIEVANTLVGDSAGEPLDDTEPAVDGDALRVALRYLQTLDPPGVGACGLAECLALQLEAMPDDTPHRQLALKLTREHLDLLAGRDFAGLRRALGCDEATLRAVQALVTRLNPRPGAPFGQTDTRYVVPDVRVVRQGRRWTARLNADAVPRLRVNRMYAELLARNRGHGGELGGRLQEARWMLRNVQQRFETILRVSQAIVARQQGFFDHGEVAMRPLVLREIAEALDLHESTISRVTTQKYMMTPRGLFELKFFFGSHVATETGGAASSTAIRALIRQLVGNENGRQPLSDSQLADILGRQGIIVARRTVAKYRESLQIPAVSLRKSL
ncbi:MAG: RNA polymerase factor sigma-54 [Rhodocyclaceae bacterium]|nr:RNA polymerase factor sigma-54 [Rhodocyclaceae bacterium]